MPFLVVAKSVDTGDSGSETGDSAAPRPASPENRESDPAAKNPRDDP
jgi:hypothetical protein